MSRERRRDAAIDRLLRAALKPGEGPPGVGCPDAERLSAFLDGALEAGERRTLEAHFAGCERCQEVVALIGRMAPATPAERAWWRLSWTGRVRWLVPAATTAVVCIAVYVAVRQPPVEREHPAPAGIAAEGRGPAPPARSTPESPTAPTADERRAQTPAGRPKAEVRRPTSPPASGEAAQPGRRRETAQAPSAESPETLSGRDVAAKQVEPPPPAPSAAVGRADGARESEKSETFARQTAARANEAVAAEEADTVSRETKMRSRAAEVATIVVARSPDGASIWRFGRAGAVAHSADGGRTWTHAVPGLPAEVLAASSPAAGVCWAVGRNGSVSLVVDDGRWHPRPFPERVDLVGIDARDAYDATVTTRDGRRFATADAGATWTPVN